MMGFASINFLFFVFLIAGAIFLFTATVSVKRQLNLRISFN